MDVPVRRRDSDSDADDEPEPPQAVVTSHETRPGKVVFTERDNADGWIATNVTVDLEP
ncbi:DUF7331 family protein [Halobiforma nitratireducens]|uniref:Uncharacterized protein n=1 Tax=Halobiforma nitratireducens JCM 10879 TaxID=1227454 RepID=M0MN87_9EURY|nr:hypothetical protein [Halobiforma nitratireducens]EMA46838.1 hypothetical protein C446_00916 [Halobiforma nitratireducens JCM 10879]